MRLVREKIMLQKNCLSDYIFLIKTRWCLSYRNLEGKELNFFLFVSHKGLLPCLSLPLGRWVGGRKCGGFTAGNPFYLF